MLVRKKENMSFSELGGEKRIGGFSQEFLGSTRRMGKMDDITESSGGGFCRYCRFFSPEPPRAGEKVKFGRCHRYAPGPCTDMSRHGYWPLVRIDDWCGEFRDKSY